MKKQEGIIIVDKPEGLSSHDVVLRVRQKLKIMKVGHGGTLDPIATGVLIIFVGNATKLFNKFSNLDKEYIATLTLGEATDTGDLQGKLIKTSPFEHVDEEQIKKVFNTFTGEIEQIPPMMSALKYKGRRLYELARKGISVERLPRRLKIYNLEIRDFSPPNVQFYLKCSKGTYVRKLAEDIAEKLFCCAYISQIRRIAVGEFRLEQAVRLDDIDANHIIPWKV